MFVSVGEYMMVKRYESSVCFIFLKVFLLPLIGAGYRGTTKAPIKGCWQQVSDELIGVTEHRPQMQQCCTSVQEGTQSTAGGQQDGCPYKERTYKV